MSNLPSSAPTERKELAELFKSQGHKVFEFGILDGEVNPTYEKLGIEYVGIDANRSNLNPFVEIRSIFNIKKVLLENKIDAAVIYRIKNHSAFTFALRLAKVKDIVCVVNGSGNLFRLKGIKGFVARAMALPMLKVAYSLAKAVSFQNSDDRDLFIRKKLVKAEKCFVTGGSGVDLSDFPQREMPKENKFLYLARITPTKGIYEYIEAAKIVKAEYPSVTFDVVGPIFSAIEDTYDLEKTISEAYEKGIIKYHGETRNVASFMKKCRFFVYPSYYPEGVPRCAMQAIATGRPVITTATPGNREVVIDNKNGFVIEPHNVNQLVEKMLWFIENPYEAEVMGEASRKYCEERFNVLAVNDEIAERLFS